MGFLSKLFGSSSSAGHDVNELARRLAIPLATLQATKPVFTQFSIPKRSGGIRQILAPARELKRLQRQILRRILGRLRAHPNATGFERKLSIVSNAQMHVKKRVVIRLDLKDFFTCTTASRVEAYFRSIGWNAEAARLLTKLVTHDGALPQGAPTSPRLSNLVNIQLDARLAAMAGAFEANYSRYADDLTFSTDRIDAPHRPTEMIHHAKAILRDAGYVLHIDKKLSIAHRHDRQRVTGLVVNDKVALPRKTRRWLRAVEHRVATGRSATITPAQLAGWRSLSSMVRNQAR